MIDLKFGNLTVVENYSNQTNKKYKLNCEYNKSKLNELYVCKCNCNNYLYSTKFALTSGKTRSCKSCKELELTNKQFGRLTALIYLKSHLAWLCRCYCGNYTIQKYKKLTSKNTQSCGCFALESIIKTINSVNKIHPNPSLESAKCLWEKRYSDGCSFDDFYKISQRNCFYCNEKPFNKYNVYTYGDYSKDTKSRGNFIYNGADRIDSTLNHAISNLVPCCKYCNLMKSDMSQSNFYEWINNILYNSPRKYITKHDMPDNYSIPNIPKLKSKVNDINFAYKKDGCNLILEEFYFLSQQNCYYCNKDANNSNFFRKIYRYNGLDRINNNLNHIDYNLVTCCKDCNWAKSNYTFEFFISHLLKIKLFLQI